MRGAAPGFLWRGRASAGVGPGPPDRLPGQRIQVPGEYLQGDQGAGPSVPAEQVARQYPSVVQQGKNSNLTDSFLPVVMAYLLVAPEGRLYPTAPPVHLDEIVRVGCYYIGRDVGGEHMVERLALSAAGGRLPGVVPVLGRPYYQGERSAQTGADRMDGDGPPPLAPSNSDTALLMVSVLTAGIIQLMPLHSSRFIISSE